MSALIAHCDTNIVTEETVMAAPAVQGTATWNPVHHSVLIRTLERSIVGTGMQIQDRRYSLSRDGLKMFGVWTLNRHDAEMAYAVGLRNSMNKSMAAGICAGTNVFVCDNLSFAGDLVQFRKHTKLIDDDLPRICEAAVDAIGSKLGAFAEWHKKLKKYVLRRVQAELLTFKALCTGVISPSEFKRFFSLYFDENALYGKPDLYSWHEAVTYLLKSKSLFSNFDKNRRLNRLCEAYIAAYGRLMWVRVDD
jgi:hypothetical protein